MDCLVQNQILSENHQKKPKPKIEVVANGDKSPEQVKPDEIEIIDESRP